MKKTHEIDEGILSLIRTFYSDYTLEPKGENPSEMMYAFDIRGKDALNIACYGGYSIWLLLNGANSVRSLDLHTSTVLHNKVIMGSITALSFQEQHSFLHNQKGEKKFIDRVSSQSGVSSGLVDSIMEYFSLTYIKNEERFRYNFPHLSTEENYSLIQEKIRSGAWTIEQGELLDSLRNTPNSSLDCIYASSVRNWVLYNLSNHLSKSKFPVLFSVDADKRTERIWRRTYDSPLAREVHRVLKSKGAFVDAIIPEEIWPFKQRPFSSFQWRKFYLSNNQGKGGYRVAVK